MANPDTTQHNYGPGTANVKKALHEALDNAPLVHHVIVSKVEPDEVAYPADEQGRRWLYTVLTRAKESLYLVASRPAHVRGVEARPEPGLRLVDGQGQAVPLQLDSFDHFKN